MIRGNTSIMTKILKHLLAVIIVTIFPALTSAGEEKVPVELQAKLFLTALTYDKNIKNREIDQLKIGIVYFPEVPDSKKESLNFSKVLEEFKDKKVGGLSMGKVSVAYLNRDDLKDKISKENINVLYLARGTHALVTEVTKVTQSEKILSFTGVTEYVVECGVSMAVGLKEGKPKIYLNLSSSRAEGADFSAKLLRVAILVGEN